MGHDLFHHGPLGVASRNGKNRPVSGSSGKFYPFWGGRHAETLTGAMTFTFPVISSDGAADEAAVIQT